MKRKHRLRAIAIDKLNGNSISPTDKIIANEFLSYINAYCCELKLTECDILMDDDTYNSVWSLFKKVMKLNKVNYKVN